MWAVTSYMCCDRWSPCPSSPPFHAQQPLAPRRSVSACTHVVTPTAVPPAPNPRQHTVAVPSQQLQPISIHNRRKGPGSQCSGLCLLEMRIR